MNDKKATAASNEANKALMVGSVGSKATPLYLPDIMRRWEHEIKRCSMTDERLRDIVALERVLFLNLQDIELITYPSLNRLNGLAVDPIRFWKMLNFL